jgi:sphinganine-1-phosphate aldolase
VELPEKGLTRDQLLEALSAARGEDADWRGGRTFSLIYNTGDDELEALLEEVARLFLHENALNPFAFPSHRRFEGEVVDMTASLLHGTSRSGTMTSGGTESILMAVKTARDVARGDRGVAEPVLVTAVTAHPAFAKAAHYLDMRHVVVPVGDDLRVDVEALRGAVDDDTALVVASAPCYPYGVIDDVGSVAALAAERGVLCHVDACLGGFLLPFWERLDAPVPPFDFRVPGVTSMSADVHKYGYCFKGASVVLYADRDLVKRQYFFYDGWPGGVYGSPAAAGARPAAPVAAAWAVMRFLGEDGYLRLARLLLDTTARVLEGIDAIDGLRVTGRPDFCAFEFGAEPGGPDIGAVGDVMDDRGWRLDRQQGGLHLMLSPYHARVADRLLADLAEAATTAATSRGREARYGGV